MKYNRIFILGGIIVFFTSIIYLVNPIGDFPLNDDWHYAFPVKTLIQNGEYQLHSYFSPNIFLQVIWGYIFCLIPNEFSFTYLRFSTLVTAVICGFVFFQMIKSQTDRSSKESFLLLLLLIFNPLFFSLSFSFMTDVPFLTLSLSSLFFYKRYLDKEKMQDRILGGFFAIAALFIRQPGVLILIAAELSILLFFFLRQKKECRSIRSTIQSKAVFNFTISLFVAILTYLFIEKFLKPWLGTSEYYISVGDEYIETLKNPKLFMFQFAKRSLMTIFYMGLFCLPLVGIFIEKIRQNNFHKKWIFTLIVSSNLLIIYVLFINGYVFPYGGNIFYNLGLGPVLLKDVYILEQPVGFEIPNFMMISFGLICQILGCYIFIWLGKKLHTALRDPLQNQFFLMLVLVNMAYLVAMMIFSYFDRYLLLLFVSILIIVYFETSFKKIDQYRSLLIFTFLFGLFSILGTKDYLTWNRLNDSIFQELISDGIDKKKIDAGLSKNGFEGTLSEIKTTHEYVLSFNELENYEVIKSVNFYRWLFFQKDQILVLKKQQ